MFDYKKITLVTGNKHKRQQVERFLGVSLAHRSIDLDELQSTKLEDIVVHKARQAYEIIGSPVLVEDAELVFTAIAPLPGPFIKWFNEIGAEKVCRILDGFSDRTAYARSLYALYDGKTMHMFEGKMAGHIAQHPSNGTMGFGFDKIFINDGYACTRAEMSEADYTVSSYRNAALAKLYEFLNAPA
jgi:non-canonical purine NTP pyrophosphatase (RdgB/HAM1 family)